MQGYAADGAMEDGLAGYGDAVSESLSAVEMSLLVVGRSEYRL